MSERCLDTAKEFYFFNTHSIYFLPQNHLLYIFEQFWRDTCVHCEEVVSVCPHMSNTHCWGTYLWKKTVCCPTCSKIGQITIGHNLHLQALIINPLLLLSSYFNSGLFLHMLLELLT